MHQSDALLLHYSLSQKALLRQGWARLKSPEQKGGSYVLSIVSPSKRGAGE